LPKGASAQVRAAAEKLAGQYGGKVFLETAKCHFKTTDDVLGAMGRSREGEGLPAAPERKAFVRYKKGEPKGEPPPMDGLF
jgi:hypothetical protein